MKKIITVTVAIIISLLGVLSTTGCNPCVEEDSQGRCVKDSNQLDREIRERLALEEYNEKQEEARDIVEDWNNS